MGDLILETRLYAMKKTLDRVSTILKGARYCTVESENLLNILCGDSDGRLISRNNQWELLDQNGQPISETIGLLIKNSLKSSSSATGKLKPYLTKESAIFLKDSEGKQDTLVEKEKADILRELLEIETSLDKTCRLLNHMVKTMASNRDNSFRIKDSIATSLSEDIEINARECSQKLGDISETLEYIKKFQEDSKKEREPREDSENKAIPEDVEVLSPEKRRDEAWNWYRDLLVEEQSLLDDLCESYVDILSGLALRDKRFDEGICQIAEELVHILNRQKENIGESLAIPAKQAALSMRLSRVIHVGFPDWTIWSLPFTAHEFWHVVISKRLKLDDALESHIKSKKLSAGKKAERDYLTNLKKIIDNKSNYPGDYSLLQELLADAFATFVMGPAYAYASILLRFDPLMDQNKVGCHASDPRRANFVLSFLEVMSEKGENIYAGIIETLKSELNSACSQAKQIREMEEKRQISNEQSCFDPKTRSILNKLSKKKNGSRYEDLLKDFENEWKKTSEQTDLIYLESDLNMLHCLAHVFYSFFDDKQNLNAYSPKTWFKVKSCWIEPICENREGEIKLEGTENLRDILNAAWYSRVQIRKRAGAYEQDKNKSDPKDKIEMIEFQARELWKRIQEHKKLAANESGSAKQGATIPKPEKNAGHVGTPSERKNLPEVRS